MKHSLVTDFSFWRGFFREICWKTYLLNRIDQKTINDNMDSHCGSEMFQIDEAQKNLAFKTVVNLKFFLFPHFSFGLSLLFFSFVCVRAEH